MPVSVVISAAVEGDVDEAIVRKLVAHAGGQIGNVYGKNGKPMLRKKIKGYNNAARHTPWLVLIDLDNDADCAPPVREEWVPDPATHLCFRIAVREVEVWLMADAKTLARFLIDDEQDRGPEFLRLANALSALYPRDSEEKRLLDAMLLAVPK
jgi:hypothetical protein